MRAGICDNQSSQPAQAAQKHALGENLADDAATARAQGYAHGHISTPRCGACQQQVCDVGAGDEQHDTREDHQHSETLARLLLQVLDAAAAGRDNDMLLGNDARAAIGCEQRAGKKPLAQRDGKLRLQSADVCAGAYPAQRIKPVGLLMMENRAWAPHIRFGLKRQPEIGRRIRYAIPEKAEGRNTDDGERPRLNVNR